MSIQNSINSALGAVAGAAIAGKKMKESKQLKEEQGMLAKEQYHEASADIAKLEGDIETAGKVLTEATEKVEATKGWNMTGKNKKMLEGKAAKRLTEKEAAERAFSELSDKLEARKAMRARAEMIMKRTGGIR